MEMNEENIKERLDDIMDVLREFSLYISALRFRVSRIEEKLKMSEEDPDEK